MKEEDGQMAKNMHSDIVLMDRYCGEVRELDKKIAGQQAVMSGTGGPSLQVVVCQISMLSGSKVKVHP